MANTTSDDIDLEGRTQPRDRTMAMSHTYQNAGLDEDTALERALAASMQVIDRYTDNWKHPEKSPLLSSVIIMLSHL